MNGKLRKSIVFILVLVTVLYAPLLFASYGLIQEDKSPIGSVKATHPGGDFGPWTGDTGNLNQPTNDTFSSTNEYVEIQSERDTTKSENQVGIEYNVDTRTGTTETVQFMLKEGGNIIIHIRLANDGDIEVAESTINTTDRHWVSNITYGIEIRNIDWSNDRFELWVNGEDLGTYKFKNTASGFDQITVGLDTRSSAQTNKVKFTDIRLDGPNYDISRFNDGTLKSFDDGSNNITVTGFQGWYNSNGNREDLVTTANALNNTWGNLTAFGSESKDARAFTDSGTYKPKNASVMFYMPQRGDNDKNSVSEIILEKNGNQIIEIRLTGDGTFDVIESGGTINSTDVYWVPESRQFIEIKDIDYEDNTFELHLNNDSVGTFTFRNNANEIESVLIRHKDDDAGSDTSLYFDNLRLNGKEFVIPKFSSNIWKGFSDNETGVEATGWAGWTDNDQNRIDPVSLTTREDSKVGKIVSKNNETILNAWSNSGFYKINNFSIKWHINKSSGSDNDRTQFILRKGQTQSIHISFQGGSGREIGIVDSTDSFVDTGFEWNPNITYTIEVRNIDYTNYTYDLHINGEKVGNYEFRNNVNEFNRIQISQITTNAGSNVSVYFNDIRLNGKGFNKPSYSQTDTGFGWKGWYESFSPFEPINKDLNTGSFEVDGSGEDAEIWSSGGAVKSDLEFGITVTNRTVHPDDNVEIRGYHFNDDQMEVRLHMSTPDDQFDPNSDVSGNAITVNDGGSFREINLTWNNDTENTIEFVNYDLQEQSYQVKINGELAENPVTGDNDFSTAGNTRNGVQNVMLRLDAVVSGNTAGYDENNISVDYNIKIGQCVSNCEAVEFFNVTTEESIEFDDPSGITPTPTPTDLEDLVFRINKFMEHNTFQLYEVIYTNENGHKKDVTNQAIITSSNTTVIIVVESENKLESTNNTSINAKITVNASYSGLTVSKPVTVANATLENIDILPNTKWVVAIVGVNDKDTDYGLGSDFQWILFIIIMMVTFSLLLNEMAGIAIGQVLLILFYITQYIPIAILLGGLIFGLFAGLIRFSKRSQTTLNVQNNNRNI